MLNWRQMIKNLFSTQIGMSGSRIRIIAFGFICVYGAIAGKLVWIGLRSEPAAVKREGLAEAARARPDIVDRNGVVMATDIKVNSVFAEPNRLVDKDEAVELITAVLPDIDARDLRKKFSQRRGFVWVKRGITPGEREEIFRLGLPGVGFIEEHKRVYPNGPVGAHVLGATNIDNAGIAGLEKYIDTLGLSELSRHGFAVTQQTLQPVRMSLDARATHAVREELSKGMKTFKAKAAAAAIMDVNTGEMVALVSLPDFDPNDAAAALDDKNINRMSVGVFEMGSTFKALTLAMALESRRVRLNTRIDARQALTFGRFRIRDFHAQARALTVSEVFTYSSNIGTGRLALMLGVDHHKAFLGKLGQTSRMRTELPESAAPIVPKRWGDLNTATIAFGHGLAVAPLQSMMAVASLVNGGLLVKPTFLASESGETPEDAPRVISEQTSEMMRYLMRLNAEVGSAKRIDVAGYFAGGKTGTANKVVNGRYANDRVFTTFTAIAPSDRPKYLFLTLYDEPQGVPETQGQRTASWNAGAVTGKIIERVMPLLDHAPKPQRPSNAFPVIARGGLGLPQDGGQWR
ncbi:MAG: penicillin-binding protein 2 [Alphaproteobacteria bacterium]|nr:penicillin-binding protein 2 [Alphaproteobacteria bacterium]